MATKWLTRQQAREKLADMPERSFARLVAKGLPRRGDGTAARFPWPEIFHWYAQQERQAGKDAARPATIDQARLRLDAATAELKELELGERRGELIGFDQAEEWLTEAFGRIRGQLHAMEPRLAATIGQCKTLQQRSKMIREAINEVLEELYRADDVPQPDVADDND